MALGRRLFAMAPGDVHEWKLRLGPRGLLLVDIESSTPIRTYVVDARDYDEDAPVDELPHLDRWSGLEDASAVRHGAGRHVVMLALCGSDEAAAVYARVRTR